MYITDIAVNLDHRPIYDRRTKLNTVGFPSGASQTMYWGRIALVTENTSILELWKVDLGSY